MKSWRQLVLDVPSRWADAFSAMLADLGALGIEVLDDQTRAMPGQGARLTAGTTLVVPFDAREGLERDVAAGVSQLVARSGEDIDVAIAWSTIDDEDWNKSFKADWKPFFVSDDVLIVPSWAESWPDAETTLFIDPGAAFGTGTHETTKLCVALLTEFLATGPVPETVLDVGTGSGILSLVALKRGVARAVGTEIDPLALDAARANMAANGLADRFLGVCGPPDHEPGHHRLVLANILVSPLIKLAPAVAAVTRPGAVLIASGVLQEQVRALEEAYGRVGFTTTKRREMAEWVGLQMVRTDLSNQIVSS